MSNWRDSEYAWLFLEILGPYHGLFIMMDASQTLLAVITALLVDAIIGDPARFWQRCPHPVVVIGGLIDWLENRWNHTGFSETRRKLSGVAAVAILLATAAICGIVIEVLLMRVLPAGYLAVGVIASVLIAQRSLYLHVADVRDALSQDGLAGGRKSVSHIIGRDPERLNQAGVARAAIESLAENFSDGIVAPAFWFAVFGLPGLIAYKAVNTADSMIGHHSERFESFGWAAARLDDIANFIPARLSAVVTASGACALMGSKAAKRAVAIAWRDAGKHKSPNAGWPEGAFAGGLDIALAGPRYYSHGLVDDEFVNDTGLHDLTASHISAALHLFVAAAVAHAALYGLVFLIVFFA